MEIADDIEVFSEFYDRMANQNELEQKGEGEFPTFISSTPKHSTSYEECRNIYSRMFYYRTIYPNIIFPMDILLFRMFTPWM